MAAKPCGALRVGITEICLTLTLAAFWAAKEAVMKALGAGVGEIALTDIETLPDASGRPVVTLHGAAADRARKAGLNHWQVSISHDGDYAIAVALAWE